MRREERLKESAQFRQVLSQRQSWANSLFALKALPNQLPFNRYGLIVSRRVGSAVVRNRVKRLLREVIRMAPTKKGWDIVFIARKASADADFNRVKEAVTSLFSQARIIASQGLPAIQTIDAEADRT
ncbi:MAG: ribonuclease P protein component [Chloroflexota bacterium]